MIGISRNGIIIGAVKYMDRKKPCLVIRKGNQDIIIGTFNNNHCVETFEQAITDLLQRSDAE
jgi:hypothetical protein